MDYCKNKQFIAFINKESKDRFWCDGSFAWEEYAPKIHPYDTPEHKQIAKEICESLFCWSETGDIEAVILTVSKEPFPMMTKKDKPALVEKWEKICDDKKKAYYEEQSKKKHKKENTEDTSVVSVDQIVVTPVVETNPEPIKTVRKTKELTVKKVEPTQVVKEEKKRSPLEIKSSQKEKETKVTTAPSEPKKQGGLSKILKKGKT